MISIIQWDHRMIKFSVRIFPNLPTNVLSPRHPSPII